MRATCREMGRNERRHEQTARARQEALRCAAACGGHSSTPDGTASKGRASCGWNGYGPRDTSPAGSGPCGKLKKMAGEPAGRRCGNAAGKTWFGLNPFSANKALCVMPRLSRRHSNVRGKSSDFSASFAKRIPGQWPGVKLKQQVRRAQPTRLDVPARRRECRPWPGAVASNVWSDRGSSIA